jgi:glycosyltransferase involved in cell wall biosynthesis
MKRKPKIFHGLVNYGTQSGLFARELRNLGYDAISVIGPDAFKRVTDIELTPTKSFFDRVKRALFYLRCFFKYDIFHFYYGTSLLPKQMDLPFYRLFGKKLIMHYLGNDIQGYSLSVEKYKWTNVSYMMSRQEGLAYDKLIQSRFNNEIKYIDKSFVCAPSYSEFSPFSEVLPLALDIERFKFSSFPRYDGQIRIMHAPTHRGFKGTEFIVKAIEQLQDKGYNIYFDLVENVTHDELLERYKLCHLFIDQIMGGWYGTATIEAMATGRPVIVGLRHDYFAYIDFADRIPAIPADPDMIFEAVKNTLDNGIDFLIEKGKKSRQFVEEYHDVKVVTKKLINIYSEL